MGYLDYLQYDLNQQKPQQKTYLGADTQFQTDPRLEAMASANGAGAPATTAGESPWVKANNAMKGSGAPNSGAGGVAMGALSGAAAGSAIPGGWGTAIGAGAGGLAALMGQEAQMEAEKRQALAKLYQEQGDDEQRAMQTMMAGWSRIL